MSEDIRYFDDSDPYNRNMDAYNEMMNTRETLDRWASMHNQFMSEWTKTGLVSAEGLGGVQVEETAFLKMFPVHDIKPWEVPNSPYKEHLTAQYKGVTFFTIR